MTTALTRTPENTNFLQTTKFTLTFPRMENVTYFCQQINMPGVSLSELQQNTPFVDLYRPGNKVRYNTFNITFLVDEELRSWLDIHDWIRGLTFPKDFTEYKYLPQQSAANILNNSAVYSDAIVTILSSLNNPKLRLILKDCFPVNLSDIQFSSTDSAETTITAEASFRFSYFDLERIG
jgi:hypothetical protein